MIFKNERAPNIKRLTTEAPRNEIDPGSPFDYRREITSIDKKEFLKEYEEALAAPHRAGDVLTIAVALKYLDIKTPPLSAEQRTRIESQLMNTLQAWETMQHHRSDIDNLSNAILYDRLLLTNLPANYEKIVTDLKEKYFNYTNLELSEVACLNILSGGMGSSLLEKQSTRIDDFSKRKFSNAGVSARFSFFYDLAMARLSGQQSLPQLDADDWRAIRSTMFEHARRNRSATHFFWARILAAKDVYVDDDGLHIIDEDHEPAASSERSVPPRKNI